MPSTREMRLRINSVKNLAQLTRALETVSASKVKRSLMAVNSTRPYAEKAWKVVVHLARQPGHSALHPLLTDRLNVNKILVVLISSDRGLAGAYNVNVIRNTLEYFHGDTRAISYLSVGRKGRDLLLRRRKDIIAEFNGIPSPPSYIDVSAIGRLVIDDYLNGRFDNVYLAFTNFVNMIKQETVVKKLLPLEIQSDNKNTGVYRESNQKHLAVFTYEPDQTELLNQIIARFTGLQVYQAILTSQASEHAARMVAMHSATENAMDVIGALQLEYNKVRQQMITSEMLDIAGGTEAVTKVPFH
jgi:F-type H+-transporting ATPase subunit gamma